MSKTPTNTDEHISKDWLRQIQLRFDELRHYGFNWRSFYNGALEGYHLAYLLGLLRDKKEEESRLKAEVECAYERGFADGRAKEQAKRRNK